MIVEQRKYINDQIDYNIKCSESSQKLIDQYTRDIIKTQGDLETCKSIHSHTESYQIEVNRCVETLNSLHNLIKEITCEKRKYDVCISRQEEVLKKLENDYSDSCKARLGKYHLIRCLCKDEPKPEPKTIASWWRNKNR